MSARDGSGIDQHPHAMARELLVRYLATIEEVAGEPILSIRGYLMFYVNLIVWGFSLWALPVIAAANAIIFITRRITGRQIRFVGVRIINRVTTPIRYLHEGEIPALKLITMRWATRLLLFRHIRARTKHLGVFLQYIEFSKWADGETPTAEIQNNEKLASVIASRLDFVLKSSVEIKSIIIVAPVIAGLNAVAKTGARLPSGGSLRLNLGQTLNSWVMLFPV